MHEMTLRQMHMPSLQAPLTDANGRMPVVWAQFLRELMVRANAEMSPGRIQPFSLTAAQLADEANFVQSGDTAGKGVGEYLGWALCNGNNGTPSLDAKFLRWSTAAAGSAGGSDSVTLSVPNLPAHTHDIKGGAAPTWAVGVSTGAGANDPNSFGFLDDLHAIVGGSPAGYFKATATGSGTAFDNRPAHYHLVPLMRITTP
jgi:hypothetical protein